MASVFYFILTLAILIAVHEFGHFWVARRSGVKVLKFSIGFGKPLWKKTGRDGTDYVLAAIPLGGYVKMLDEREGDVESHEQHLAFNRQPLATRFAVVVAGPLANLLFAIAAYWLVFVIGISGVRGVVGDVISGSAAAQAGITAGDEIVAINGEQTATWTSIRQQLSELTTKGGKATLTVRSGDNQSERLLNVPKLALAIDEVNPVLTMVGLQPVAIAISPVIDKVIAGGAADRAGLKSGDKVLTVNNEAIDNWVKLVELVRSKPGAELAMTVERDGQPQQVLLTVDQTEQGLGKIGASVDSRYTSIPDDLQAVQQYGIVTAAIKAVSTTWQTSVLIVKSLVGMITGDVSAENIGGPLSIAQFAGASAANGPTVFISFLALISISLGVLNLLPIPVLDGGHLMMYIVEAVRGKPVSEKAQLIGQKIGISMILALTVFAFFNDLTRLFG